LQAVDFFSIVTDRVWTAARKRVIVAEPA